MDQHVPKKCQAFSGHEKHLVGWMIKPLLTDFLDLQNNIIRFVYKSNELNFLGKVFPKIDRKLYGPSVRTQSKKPYRLTVFSFHREIIIMIILNTLLSGKILSVVPEAYNHITGAREPHSCI